MYHWEFGQTVEEDLPKSQFPSSSVVIAEAKKKFSESSKLCSIAYYSCHKGSVFGSQMPVTSSWLQAICKARSKSHGLGWGGNGQGSVQEGASFTGISGKPRGWEGRKHTNKYISKVRLKSSWWVRVLLSREKSQKLIKSRSLHFFKCKVYVNIIK